MVSAKAIAQSAISLGELGRSPIDEEVCDGPSIEQGSPRPIPDEPKQRLPKSNDKHIIPSGEMKESSLHSSARKHVRFSNENYNLETDQLDWENLDCEHNMIHESKTKGNETRAQQAIESKKSKEPPQKSEAGGQSSQSTPNEIRRKHKTSLGPVMGTFKTPWQMLRDAEAKKQAKASKRTGTNKQAPAIGRSARSGIPTPAAHVQVRDRETPLPSIRSSTYIFQPAESGSGMSKKRKLAAGKHGSRKRAAPAKSSEVLHGSKHLPAFRPHTLTFSSLSFPTTTSPKIHCHEPRKLPRRAFSKSGTQL